MNSNNKHKSKKQKISTKLNKLSYSSKDGNVFLSKGRLNNFYLNTATNHNTNLHVSTSHMQFNQNKTQLIQGAESFLKVKEEMTDLKARNKELIEDNQELKAKLLQAERALEEKEQHHKDIIYNESVNDQRYDTLLLQSARMIEVLIEVAELFLFHPKGVRDSARMMNTNNNNDNISFSIDVYEPSISNDDDRRLNLLEQIQSLMLFKLKVFHDQFGLDIENLKGRIGEWSKGFMKEKENSNNSISFSNISQIKSKAQQNVIGSSISYSEYNTSSNMNIPLSPKFYRDEASDFCKSLNESEIKELNEKDEDQANRNYFTEEPKLLNFQSFKSIQAKDTEQEGSAVLKEEFDSKKTEDNKHYREGEEERELHVFSKEDHKTNDHIEISFEGKFD